MAAADHDPAEGADVVNDGPDEEAYAEEGDEEADRGEKEAAAWPIGNALVKDASGARQVQEQQHDGGEQDDEQQQNQGSGQVHRVQFLTQAERLDAAPIIKLGHFSLKR